MNKYLISPEQAIVPADLLRLQSYGPEGNAKITAPVIVKPQVQMEEELKQEILCSAEEKGFVILRCSIDLDDDLERYIAIDKASVLKTVDSDTICRLLFIDQNITYYPTTLYIPFERKTHYFTLIFEGLPRHTRQFHFIEYTLGASPFYKYNIIRNNTDVYDIKIDC